MVDIFPSLWLHHCQPNAAKWCLLHWSILSTHHCTALNCTALNWIILHCTVLHCPALHCNVLHCTALHYTALHFSSMHWTSLQGTAMHFNKLHCIILHNTALHTNCFVLLYRSPLMINMCNQGPHREADRTEAKLIPYQLLLLFFRAVFVMLYSLVLTTNVDLCRCLVV